MGYAEEARAGHVFVPLTPIETCPGPSCGRLTQSHVRFVLPSGTKGPHIKAFCSECDFRRELGLKTYGPLLLSAFPEIQPYLISAAPRKRSKIYESGSPEFYAMFDWCCVYCEGFRLAQEYRLRQIESLTSGGLSNHMEADVDESDSAFETRTSELLTEGRAWQNIFDLVPDHLIPVWVQELPDLTWKDEAKRRAERVWVVSAHRSCNSKRKKQLENADFLLFVYSRYLFPRSRLSDMEKVTDLIAFTDVLHNLEIYKVHRHLTILKPDRRAM